MGSLPNSKTSLETITESLSMKGKVLFTTASPKDHMTSLARKTNDPFYVLDMGVVARLMDRWAHSLPDIRPFYAVKCNPDPNLLAALSAMGSGFDCASRAEIEAVLALGASPGDIIFANPCKLDSDLDYAASAGVNLATFDSESEIQKIKKLHPRCSLLLRIKLPLEGCAVRSLGSKYGALPEEVDTLLRAARDAGLSVTGVSFHVGSAATDARSYSAAVEAAKGVFETAERLGMPAMRVLDVGGGFFAVGQIFEEAALAINAAVTEHFRGVPGPRVVAEPGRFFAESAFALAAKIVGKRVRGGEREYWINDGIYGSFLGSVVVGAGNGSDLTCVPLLALLADDLHACNKTETTSFESTVFGPTCDSLDTVLKGYLLPELEVGNWLVFPDMGAYSYAFKSNFNGFNTTPHSTVVVANYAAPLE